MGYLFIESTVQLWQDPVIRAAWPSLCRWALMVAVSALLVLAPGCGAVDHAKVTQRLEQRIEKLERRWAEYISIDAPSSARVDSSIAKIRKAIELLTWRLQRMQK